MRLGHKGCLEEAEQRCCPGRVARHGCTGRQTDLQEGCRTELWLPLITGNVVLILEGVPALNLLVFVLQTLVPVFQALPLCRNAELTAACRKGRREHSELMLIFHCKALASTHRASPVWGTQPHGDLHSPM